MKDSGEVQLDTDATRHSRWYRSLRAKTTLAEFCSYILCNRIAFQDNSSWNVTELVLLREVSRRARFPVGKLKARRSGP